MRTFRIKRGGYWVAKLLELRGEPKFALKNFEVGGSVLVEKMYTPETKKYA